MKTYSFGILECRHGHISMFMEEMLTLGHRCVGIWEPDEPALARSLCTRFGVPLLESDEPLWSPDVDIIGTSAINSADEAAVTFRHAEAAITEIGTIGNNGGIFR